MKTRRIIPAIILLILIVGTGAFPAQAASGRGRAVVLLAESVTPEELFSSGLPNLQQVISNGAAGFMTTRTSGGLTSEKVILTISAGNLAVAGVDAVMAYGTAETHLGQQVGEMYRARTGHKAPQSGAVAVEIASIWRRIADSDTSGHPGLLGTSLHQGGRTTAVVGNSDTLEAVRRTGVLLAMDDQGRVDYGEVDGETVVADHAFPGGLRADIHAIADRFNRLPGDSGLVVLEFGDLARVELEQERLMDRVIPAHRAAALRRADELLGRILASLDPQEDLLLILGVVPMSKAVDKGDRLAPVILYGHGIGQGVIMSRTTRTKGLMTPEDVTATILGFLNVQPIEPIVGRPVLAEKGTLDELRQDHRGWLTVEQIRRPILEGYVYLLIIGILGAAVLLLFWPSAGRLNAFARYLLVALSAVPLTFLILPLLNPSSVLTAGIAAVAVTAALSAAIILCSREPVDSLGWVSGLTVLVILIDALSGGFFMHRSVLSYSPMVGARFYGIGNEYMGIAVGASIVAGAAALDRFGRQTKWMRWIVYAVFIAVTVVVALPGLGANVGGALTAAVGFTVTAFMVRGRKLRVREFLVAGGGAVAVLGLLVLNEVLRGQDQMTHLGRAFMGVTQAGPSWFLTIIQRKIAMNLRLFRYTYWTWVLIAFIFILPVLFKRPPHVLAKVFRAHPILRKGFIGSVLASLVALAVNDSGVVAAATCMIYAGMGLIYMILNEVDSVTPAERYEADADGRAEVSQ